MSNEVKDLYGEHVDTKSWEELPYKKVLSLKVTLAYEQVALLMDVPYMERDTSQVTNCLRAAKFNGDLLKELT